jgi:AcrR family transcriptional regulator
VTAAIQLLDREGLAALSMRRLAEELGTGAASLYWHVGSKDGLPPHLAVQGYLLLIATINGFTIDETGVDDGPAAADSPLPIDPDDLQQVANMARDYIASLPASQFPNMTTLAGEFAFSDPDERFELLIDIFVDGLARRAAVT